MIGEALQIHSGSTGSDFHFSTIFAERGIRSFIKKVRSITGSGHELAQWTDYELHAHGP
jgi:hypothetical protein